MSLAAFKKFFAADPLQETAHHAYVTLVNQSRKPFFYEQFGVADSIDGRFDVIVLHLFMVARRLRTDSPELLRSIWEVFFSDMDRSLREMGASDTGIGKRIKKMVQAFYGRIDSYENSIDSADEFKESLKRNLYRGQEVSDAHLEAVADYVRGNIEYLQTQSVASLLMGELKFTIN